MSESEPVGVHLHQMLFLSGGALIDAEYVGMAALMASIAAETGAAPNEWAEVPPGCVDGLGYGPRRRQTGLQELQDAGLLRILPDGRWLFSQRAAELAAEGLASPEITRQVDADLQLWLERHR